MELTENDVAEVISLLISIDLIKFNSKLNLIRTYFE